LSQNDPCAIATEYADRMSKCATIAELRAIGDEIKANLDKVAGFEGWLRDWYVSRATDLNTPSIPFENTLNSAGKKALKKGLI
jgi:hypothetical protein